MKRRLGLLAFVLLMPVGGAAAQEVDWQAVGPLFAAQCVMCHSGAAAPAGLHLDTFEAAIAGGLNGPVMIAGDPAASELMRRVRGESLPAMPLAGAPLEPEEIALIEAFIVAGMPLGELTIAPPVAAVTLPLPGEPVTFAHVEPIFLGVCVACHSAFNPNGAPPEGLQFDSLAAILAGGDRVVVIPGRADASEIVRRIEGRASPAMPLGGPPLGAEQIDLIRRWIDGGAMDAAGIPAGMPAGEIRIEGRMTGAAEIDGIAFIIDAGTRIDGRPGIGEEAELRGVLEPDGTIRATRLDDD